MKFEIIVSKFNFLKNKIYNFLFNKAFKMLSNQKLYTFSRRLEWTLLLILFAGAIYFQYETWTMYLRQDSSFKIKEENIEEGPTLTFCPRAGYEILKLLVAKRLEHLNYNLHHFNSSGWNFLIDGPNTINWQNQNITINQYTIKTLWGTCVMLEFDFEDITKFVRDWIVIYMFFVEDLEPDFWRWTDDIENQDINQNETWDIILNKTERISQDWLGYDVYVTSKVEFV